jgi:hypothetical protein
MGKSQSLKFVSFVASAVLVLGSFLVALDLVRFFLKGKLSVYAPVVHLNLIATALVGKLLLSRVRKKLPIKMGDYILACLVGIINLLGSFPNLGGIILSAILIVCAILVYRAKRGPQKEGGLSGG